MTDEEKKAAEEKAAAEAEAALNAKINAAITAHMKRATTAFEKVLDEKFAKLAPAREDKPADKPADGAPGAAKADPEVLKLREQLDKLTRQADEDRAARAAVEEKARREGARTTLRDALAAKGVTGARARAVIADLEASGAVRWNDEGELEIEVKRPRAKGARPEAAVHHDIGEAIEDWAKGPDAAEFLPAPSTTTTARRPGTPTPATRSNLTTTNPQRALTDEEVAAVLTGKGVDLDALVNNG